MGSYSYAANPILLNKGNLLSVKLSKLNIYYYNNPNNFSLGNNFTFYLTLVDLMVILFQMQKLRFMKMEFILIL